MCYWDVEFCVEFWYRRIQKHLTASQADAAIGSDEEEVNLMHGENIVLVDEDLPAAQNDCSFDRNSFLAVRGHDGGIQRAVWIGKLLK